MNVSTMVLAIQLVENAIVLLAGQERIVKINVILGHLVRIVPSIVFARNRIQ